MISESNVAVDYPGYVYGGLVAMGGIMGYVKRQIIYIYCLPKREGRNFKKYLK